MSGAICPAVFVTSSPLTWGNSRWFGFFAQRGWDVLTWPGKLFNWWSRVTPRQRTAMHSWLHHPDTTSTQPRLEWMGFHGFLFGDVFFCAKEIVVTRIHVYIEIPIVSWGMCGLLTSSHLQAFPVTTGGVSCEDWFSFGMASLCIYIYMHTHTYIYIYTVRFCDGFKECNPSQKKSNRIMLWFTMTFQAELFSSQIGQLIVRQRNKTCVNVATCLVLY